MIIELLIVILVAVVMVQIFKLLMKGVNRLTQRINATKAAGTTQGGKQIKPLNSGTKKKRRKSNKRS